MENENIKKYIKGAVVSALAAGVGVVGTLVVVGNHTFKEENVGVPVQNVEFTFEKKEKSDDDLKPVRELKVKTQEEFVVMPAEEYTLNDVISQIEIELRRTNGVETEKIGELMDLRDALQREEAKEEAKRTPRPTPPGRGRRSEVAKTGEQVEQPLQDNIIQ